MRHLLPLLVLSFALLSVLLSPDTAHAQGGIDALALDEGSGEATAFEVDVPEWQPTWDAPLGTLTVLCDGVPCTPARFGRSLLALIDLQPGQILTESTLQTALVRMAAIEAFSALAVEVVPSGAGTVDLTIRATRVDLISGMRVRAQLALGSEIRRRLFLRSGQQWTNDEQVIQRQVDTIQEYLQADGFFDSRVTVRARPEGEHQVELLVRVQRGTRRSIGTVYVRGNEALDYATIEDLLMGEFNLSRTFTTERFERAQDALLRRYRQAGYLQARVLLDETRFNEDGSVDLFVEVREGDRWRVVFRGNRLLTRRALESRLMFLQTGFIDDEEIRLAVRAIESRYETIGHLFAEVSASESVAPDGVRELVFDIREGVTAEIRSIQFPGATAFEPAALQAVIGTTEYAVVSAGGFVQRAVLDQDVSSIESMYRQAGFLEAEVTRVVLVGDNDGRDLTVAFHIQEGVQTRIATYETSAADALPSRIRERLQLAPGLPFNVEAFQNDIGVLSAGYREAGYPYPQVSGTCQLADGTEADCSAPAWPLECRRSIATDVDEACDRTSRGGIITEECILVRPDPACQPGPGIRGETVALRIDVEPGGRARFGEVFIQGNFLTRESVLRQELPFRPGDSFRYESLLQGQSNVRALRLFDSVRAQTIWTGPEGSEDNVAHVLIQLEETRYHSFDHRVGLETRFTPNSNLLVIFSNEPTWRHANLGGFGVEGRAVGNFDIDILQPERINEGEFRAGLSLVYLDPRFWFGNLLRDAWEMRLEFNLLRDQLAVPPAPQRRTIEAALRLREEFDRFQGLFFEAALSVRRTSVLDQSDPVVVSTTFDPALILSITPRLTLERRDNPLNPTQGGYAQVQLEIADDFAGVLNSARFTKFSARGSYYWPLGAGFVFGANLRTGIGVGGISRLFRSSGAFSLPLSERFALGGVTSLRGFAEGQVSTIATDEFGGDIVLNANVELRYPFLRDWGIYGATFLDAGQLARNLDELSPGRTRLAAGLGLRILIAELLPVVLDYGALLDRRPGERFGRLHFNIGYTF